MYLMKTHGSEIRVETSRTWLDLAGQLERGGQTPCVFAGQNRRVGSPKLASRAIGREWPTPGLGNELVLGIPFKETTGGHSNSFAASPIGLRNPGSYAEPVRRLLLLLAGIV